MGCAQLVRPLIGPVARDGPRLDESFEGGKEAVKPIRDLEIPEHERFRQRHDVVESSFHEERNEPPADPP